VHNASLCYLECICQHCGIYENRPTSDTSMMYFYKEEEDMEDLYSDDDDDDDDDDDPLKRRTQFLSAMIGTSSSIEVGCSTPCKLKQL